MENSWMITFLGYKDILVLNIECALCITKQKSYFSHCIGNKIFSIFQVYWRKRNEVKLILACILLSNKIN